METLKELLQFMQPNQRLDLKAVALTHVLGLTGSAEGKAAILSLDDMLIAIFGLTNDSAATIAKDAVLALINLTAEAEGAVKIFETAKQVHPRFAIVDAAVRHIIDENSELADPWTMVLSNLTRNEQIIHEIVDEIDREQNTILNLVKAFVNLDYNKKKSKLHYLGPTFCNLTQTLRGREIVCKSPHHILDKLLPFASFEESLVRRGGIVGVLKNICFDPVFHDILDSEENEILSAILRPLCGPEEFTDEENEKFPIDLQYLPETKTREEDPDLRKMLLESLLQLCATKHYRELLRSKGVYEILREYHKWEANVGKDRECLLACENVVDILIKKEEEIGLDNYKDVEVPNDLVEKFTQQDTDYLSNIV